MSIFDKFKKKDAEKEDDKQEKYIEDAEQDIKMPTTSDKVDVDSLNEEEFEAYVRDPNIFKESKEDVESSENKDTADTSDDEKVAPEKVKSSPLSILKGLPFMKKKKDSSNKEEPEKVDVVSDLKDEESEAEEHVDLDDIPLDELSLDDLEKMYEDDPDKLNVHSDVEDLSGVVSLRSVNKRFERLSEKEERRKEVERAKRKKARKQLLNGTFAILVFGGVFYSTYLAFEEPLNAFASSTYQNVKIKVNSVFNQDLYYRFKDSVTGVFEPEEEYINQGEYGKEYPEKVNKDKISKEEFTITNGNYIVGRHFPEGLYILDGKIDNFTNDLSLAEGIIAGTKELDKGLVYLAEGETLTLTGTMYPNAYRDDTILDISNLKNDVYYSVGKDIEKGTKLFLQGEEGLVEFYDGTLSLIGEKSVNNTKTVTIKDGDFVKFTGINSFSLK